LKDLVVDDRLHAADLGIGHRCAVREVEARLVRIDERALCWMRAQHVAQRLVHQVRHRVVAHRARTRRMIDARGDDVADIELAGGDRAVVPVDLRLDFLRILDGE
jgi:hypothetical protein